MRTFKSTSRRQEINFKNELYANIRDNMHCTNALWTVFRGCRRTSTCHRYFGNLFNNDRDGDEDFKSQICDVITNYDFYCINCENNIPHQTNVDITLSSVEDVLTSLENNKSPGVDGF